jgi:tRNA-binding EMAP/Myf-like protein
MPTPSSHRPADHPITWQDFEKIDLRAGTILEVREFPEAKNPARQLTIDFGKLGIKRSSAQITHPGADSVGSSARTDISE